MLLRRCIISVWFAEGHRNKYDNIICMMRRREKKYSVLINQLIELLRLEYPCDVVMYDELFDTIHEKNMKRNNAIKKRKEKKK